MAFLDEHLQPAEKRKQERIALEIRLGKRPPPGKILHFPDQTTTPVKAIEPIGVKPLEPVHVPITESDADQKRVLLALKKEFDSLKERLDAILGVSDAAPVIVAKPMQPIIQAVASYFDLTAAELLSPRREQPVCRARQVAMFLVKEMTPRSMPQIGRILGRHHTTVLSAVRRVEALRKIDAELQQDIDNLRSLLGARNG